MYISTHENNPGGALSLGPALAKECSRNAGTTVREDARGPKRGEACSVGFCPHKSQLDTFTKQQLWTVPPHVKQLLFWANWLKRTHLALEEHRTEQREARDVGILSEGILRVASLGCIETMQCLQPGFWNGFEWMFCCPTRK